jgi:hypothetical protein
VRPLGGFVYHVLNRSVGTMLTFRKQSDFEGFGLDKQIAPRFLSLDPLSTPSPNRRGMGWWAGIASLAAKKFLACRGKRAATGVIQWKFG